MSNHNSSSSEPRPGPAQGFEWEKCLSKLDWISLNNSQPAKKWSLCSSMSLWVGSAATTTTGSKIKAELILFTKIELPNLTQPSGSDIRTVWGGNMNFSKNHMETWKTWYLKKFRLHVARMHEWFKIKQPKKLAFHTKIPYWLNPFFVVNWFVKSTSGSYLCASANRRQWMGV